MEPASNEIPRIRGVPDTAAGENRGLPCAPNVGFPSLIIRKGLDTPILDGLANRAMRNAPNRVALPQGWHASRGLLVHCRCFADHHVRISLN
jgi:hypothetical protein